jgi:hypothetical protein
LATVCDDALVRTQGSRASHRSREYARPTAFGSGGIA